LTIPPATTLRAANIIGLGYLWTNTDDKDGVNSESANVCVHFLCEKCIYVAHRKISI